MNTRDKILNSLRKHPIPEVPLPDVAGDWITFDDPKRQFADVLSAVGGQVLEVADRAELAATLAQLDAVREAKELWSRVPELPSRGVDWESVKDPHELEKLDACVAPGEWAVAENGAVWLTHEAIPHRAALFIAQHLVLVVPASNLVNNMHEAYSRIKFDAAEFGVFISGPSKTADIEQSLVVGAHGARSLSVVLVPAAEA